jgi:hypothetical protein
MSQAHLWLAMLIAVLIAANVVFGVALRSWLRDDKQPPAYWRHIRTFHRVSGYVMVLAGFVNCYLGAELMFGALGRWVLTCYFGAFVVLYILGYAYDEWAKDRHDPFSHVGLDNDNARRLAMSQSANSMTMAEVRANVTAGCKWVIMQG